jgi:hypothetical protein
VIIANGLTSEGTAMHAAKVYCRCNDQAAGGWLLDDVLGECCVRASFVQSELPFCGITDSSNSPSKGSMTPASEDRQNLHLSW